MSEVVKNEDVRQLTPIEELALSTKELDKIIKKITKLNEEVASLQVLAFEKQEEIQNLSLQLV